APPPAGTPPPGPPAAAIPRSRTCGSASAWSRSSWRPLREWASTNCPSRCARCQTREDIRLLPVLIPPRKRGPRATAGSLIPGPPLSRGNQDMGVACHLQSGRPSADPALQQGLKPRVRAQGIEVAVMLRPLPHPAARRRERLVEQVDRCLGL